MTKKYIFLLVSMLMLMFFAQAQYDLANFIALPDSVSTFLEDLNVTQLNPTFGSESNFVFDVTAKSFLAISSRFVVNIGAAIPTSALRARVLRLNETGAVVQSSRWRAYNEITGPAYGLAEALSLEDLFNPTNIFEELTGIKLIIPTDWSIFPGDHIQIEVAGAKSPSLFMLWSTACQNAFKEAPPEATVISNAVCCGDFSISVVTGAITDLLGLFSNGNIDPPIVSSTCPNYGGTAENFAPPNCANDASTWTEDQKSLCCQYDNYSATDQCLSYRCSINWTADECCAFTPPDSVDPIHSACPICSAGNFDTTICCDRYDTANPQYLWNYQNDARCDAVFCQCEDWTVDRCCFKFQKNNFFYEHNGTCPTCSDPTDATDWNQELCCQLSEWWAKPICVCDADNYNKDLCCNTSAHNPVLCSVAITPDPTPIVCAECPECDCECDCDCEEEEEEPSCPCDFFDGTGEGATNTYLKVDKHELDVSDVHSGHNTVVINHLHIDTHIDLANPEDIQTLRDLLPTAMLTINSGGGPCGAMDSDEVAENVSQSVQSQIDKIAAEVKKSADEVKSVVDGVVDATNSALAGTVTQIEKLLPSLGGGTAAIASVIRQTITAPRRISSVEMVLVQTLSVVGDLAGSQFKWISQNPILAPPASSKIQADSTGFQLTYEITSKKLTAADLEAKANSQTAAFITALNSQFNTSDFRATSAKSVSASNECIPGTCTASCQCDLFYTCSADEQCLSNSCKDGKCYDAALGNSASLAGFSMGLALVAVIAMLF